MNTNILQYVPNIPDSTNRYLFYLHGLRVHGIIRKLPSQNRYLVTLKGARLNKLLNAILAVSTEKFWEKAA